MYANHEIMANNGKQWSTLHVKKWQKTLRNIFLLHKKNDAKGVHWASKSNAKGFCV